MDPSTLPPLAPREGERMLALASEGDVQGVADLLVSRDCRDVPAHAVRARALDLLAEQCVERYRGRWTGRFGAFLAGVGLAGAPDTAIADVLGEHPQHARFRDNAVHFAQNQVRSCAEGDEKMAYKYLAERISDGMQLAYQQELWCEAEERGTELVARIVGDHEPALAAARKLRADHDEAALNQAMDIVFWRALRHAYVRAARAGEAWSAPDAVIELLGARLRAGTPTVKANNGSGGSSQP